MPLQSTDATTNARQGSHLRGMISASPAIAAWSCMHGGKYLRASARTLSSPSAHAAVTIWHMHPTMAAVEELSAPPDRGSRYPAAPAAPEKHA